MDGFGLIRRFFGSKKRLVGVVALSAVLVVGLIGFLQTGKVVEAALLDPHPGLVGWWRFDEGSGTVAEDSSGNGNDGTIFGATWVDGKYGKALSFDGTDDDVNVGNDASITNLTGDLTISFWINYSSGNPTFEHAIGPNVNSKFVPWRLIIKETSSGNLQFLLFQGDGINSENAFAYYGDIKNQWTHVAITRENKTVNFFKNGVFLKSQSFTLDPISTSVDVSMMFRQHPSECDEVRIYNLALSADDIKGKFEEGPGFSSRVLANVPKGTTLFIATLSWQGVQNINVTIESPSETYTEDLVPVYQKTAYSSNSGDTLNIKRLEVSVNALVNDESWTIVLGFNDVRNYKLTVEIQK